MDFVIAIPSFNRLKMIQEKTLNFLSRHLFSYENVYIFSNKSCFEEYKKLLES